MLVSNIFQSPDLAYKGDSFSRNGLTLLNDWSTLLAENTFCYAFRVNGKHPAGNNKDSLEDSLEAFQTGNELWTV